MGLPRKERYFFLCNKDNQTISIDESGGVVTNAKPVPLADSPSGWRDISIAFGTNNKYWSLNRSFTVPLKFVGQGADILRYYIYNGKGYEEELYVKILRWNSQFEDQGKEGRYELEYSGRIDFTKMKDDPLEGVTVNTIEGGLLSYLNANDGVTYEIPCNATNKDCVKVQFDGITLFDKYKYSFIQIPLDEKQLVLPTVFLSNEGDSVGIIHGDQSYESLMTADPNYFQNSSNYIFSSELAINGVNFYGSIKFSFTGGYQGFDQTIGVVLSTDLGQDIILVPLGTVITPSNLEVSFNGTINLAANEKVFLTYGFKDLTGVLTLEESTFYIGLTSKNSPSISYALQPLQLGQQLVSKMTNGRYTMKSDFFTVHNNIVAAGGEAIRGMPDAVLKTTFQDYFNSYNAIYNLGIKPVDNVLWIEPKATLYGDSSDVFNLGEVSDFSISYAEEYLANSVKVGYPVQDYSERNGRFEFNDTIEEKLPVTAVNKEYNIVSKYRGDSYGIEFNRGKLNNKDTTDNKGDNEVFLINVDTSASSAGVFLSVGKAAQDNVSGTISFDTIILQTGGVDSYISINETKSSYSYINTTNQKARIAAYFYGTKTGEECVFELLINGMAVATQMINDFQTSFRVTLNYQANLTANDVITVVITMPVNLTGAGMDIQILEAAPVQIYTLKRAVYENLTGVPTPTVYNIEEMTPKRMLLAHGNYLRSLLFQLPGEKITFQTADKNKDLSTTLDGVTITEKADVPVGELADPLFLPFEITFTTRVPFSFAQVMAHIYKQMLITYNGYPIKLLPIGDMKCKPVTDEAQEWKLLASPENSLDTLLKLSEGALIISDYMRNQIIISDLNPVHFVKYNGVTPEIYHFKGMYDDRFEARLDRYDSKGRYYQKWQTNDTINLQFTTVGYGPLELQIFNCKAEQVAVIAATIVHDSSVQPPYVRQEFSINFSTYGTGVYQLVILVTGIRLAISEWQQVSTDLPDTLLLEYYNTRNKPDAYFKGWRPSLRVEGFLPPPTPESSSTTYEDEPGDTELLHGEGWMKQKVLLGDGYGLPDYMAKKLNRILLLNHVSIEGVEYTKVGDAKLEPSTEVTGYPMMYYTIDMRESNNSLGIVISDIEMNNSFTSTLTLDAEAFGGAPGVTQIEID